MEYLDQTALDNNVNDLNLLDDYSDDDDSNDINYDDIHFNSPMKNKDNLYIAHLEEKIIIELDNLDVFEIIEDNGKHYVFFNLDLDNDDQEELIELLYNLDEVALDKCFEYSVEWFKRELTEDKIEQLYVPLYIDNYKNKNHILMKVEINPNIDIAKITSSNINIIEIKGLVFYKKTFLYHVYLDNVIEEEINITDTVEKSEASDLELTQEDTSESVQDTLAQEDTSESAQEHVQTELDISQQELIQNQRRIVQEIFLKSKQQNKEAERIQKEAIESANKLEELELKFKQTN